MRHGIVALVLVSTSLLVTASDFIERREAGPGVPVRPVLSPPLRSLPLATDSESSATRRLIENYRVPQHYAPTPLLRPDPVVQSAPGVMAPTATGVNFEGVPVLNSAPPDTNGRVGKDHYVQWVNTQLAVWDKTGKLLLGPIKGNQLFQALGGTCALQNSGDPIAQYDLLADRWVLSQFAVNAKDGAASHECVAVSKTGDPLGEYYLYDFRTHVSTFVDYPHWGMWTDGYYMTTHQFGSSVTQGLYVFDRERMLAGQPASFQLKDLGGSLGAMASDLDSLSPPPPGAPNYVIAFGSPVQDGTNGTVLHLWKAKATWGASPTFTVTGPTDIAVSAFQANACPDTFAPGLLGRPCVQEPGPTATQQDWLDVISDRMMYRLAYRYFPAGTPGDPAPREVLVMNHTVAVGAQITGIRWYELRNPNGTPTIFQQSTFAPNDPSSRWMGSIAMDNVGNILLGYSKSSLVTAPELDVAGRLATDAVSTLGAEVQLVPGGGSQIGTGNRWGDYSAMTVDPYDGCTFWFTSEYLPATGSFNWKTRIASYRFPGCVPPVKGTIEGVVTDCDSGVPLSRAQVTSNVGFSGTSGSDGRYSIVVPPGTYSLTANSEDRACTVSSPSTVTVADGARVTRNFCLAGDPLLQLSATSADDPLGNGNHIINKDECISASATLFNSGCAKARDVKGLLSTTTQGVTINQALTPFPDVAIDSASSNPAPYTFSVSPTFACGTPIDLSLLLKSNGPDLTRSFSLPTCQGPAVTRSGSITASDSVHANRLGRDGTASQCKAVKACPGPKDVLPNGSPDPSSGNRNYDTYSFSNPAAAPICVTVTLTADASCTGNNQLQSASYQGSFNSANLCTNYLGDNGGSPDQGFNSYQFKVAAGQNFAVNVNAVQVGGSCSSYQLKVEGFIDSTTSGLGACGGGAGAPIANDDTASTSGGPVTIPVLANDSASGFAPLTLISITQPAKGSAVANADGTVTYTPQAGFVTGSDTFRYTIANSKNLTATATVTVTLVSSCTVTPAGDKTFDFQTGAQGWTVNTAVNAGTVNWSIVNGEYFTDDPAVGPKDDRLVSPLLDLSATSHFQFVHRFNTESGFDGGALEVSLDGGTTWQDVITAGGIFVQGAYNASASGLPAAWSGLSASYPSNDPVDVNVSALAGVGRRFRFRSVADGNTGVQGWFVDNVKVTNTVSVNCPVNLPPTAFAGNDFSVNQDAAVLLSGSGTDPENSKLSYAWTQLSGPSVALANADTATASFFAPRVATDTRLVFRLTVTDTGGLSGSANVTVTVLNVSAGAATPAPPSIGDNHVLGGATGGSSLLVLGLLRGWRRRRR